MLIGIVLKCRIIKHDEIEILLILFRYMKVEKVLCCLPVCMCVCIFTGFVANTYLYLILQRTVDENRVYNQKTFILFKLYGMILSQFMWYVNVYNRIKTVYLSMS